MPRNDFRYGVYVLYIVMVFKRDETLWKKTFCGVFALFSSERILESLLNILFLHRQFVINKSHFIYIYMCVLYGLLPDNIDKYRHSALNYVLMIMY